jgi:glutathione S-transferase
MALTLYGVYRSRATRNIWLLKELDVPFEHVPVIQAYRLAHPLAMDAPINTASPSFRVVNPNGLIPVLEDNGLIITESLAINLYLAKKHGGPLAPRDLAEDAQMTMWALWAMTECEPHTLAILYNRVAKPEHERDKALADASVIALQRPFDVLETHLAAHGGCIVGGRFTVADINLAEVLRYAQGAPELFDSHPSIKAWIDACQSRPAFRTMMEQRNAEPA